jgi:hypothetical protein
MLHRQVYAKVLGSFPDRIKNLYFSYLFLLRAVNKVMLPHHRLRLFNFDAFESGCTHTVGI